MPISNYPAPRLPINNSQWRYTAVGGETSLSGYDNFGNPLQYTVNNELLYQNGVLLVRNVDYIASTGNTITGLTALTTGDVIEILTYSNFSLTTIPVANINGLVQNSQLQNPSITIGSTTVSFGSTLSTLTGLTIDGINNTIHTNRGATNPVSGQVAGDLFWNTTNSALQLWNGTAWISFAPPAAPTIGTATDVGTGRAFNNAAAIVTFTPNNTGGSAQQYFVTSTPGALTSYGASSPITITGLTSSTQYTFTVTAQGAFGNSNASSSTGTLTVTSVPQAPTIGTVTASGLTVSIPFTAGSTGGSSITSYTVTSSSGKTATGSSSPLSISESTASSFTYTVTATNANGTSSPSSTSNSITTVAPTITGGSLSSDTTYYYRTFTGNGSLVVTNSGLTADILQIAGGGGSGGGGSTSWFDGAGGGAGGVSYLSSQSLSTNTYSITVGAGGSAGIAQSSGGNGANSQFGALTAAVGGGGGGSANSGQGGNGGSGGGAGPNSTSIGTGTSGQGNNGGSGRSNGSSGGGGGAGSAGGNAAAGQAGAGGAGTNSYSLWLSAISSSMTGVSGWSTATSGGYIAGGGGAGATVSPTDALGSGGAGGGGAGSAVNTIGNAGTTNTGGGAGGSGGNSNIVGATGGSGIVVVRYTRVQVGG